MMAQYGREISGAVESFCQSFAELMEDAATKEPGLEGFHMTMTLSLKDPGVLRGKVEQLKKQYRSE
jgi:hypothetical protein